MAHRALENYKLTVDRLRSHLRQLDVWLLVLDKRHCRNAANCRTTSNRLAVAQALQ
jgi:hypothetical protein